jgi:hypothetical protein
MTATEKRKFLEAVDEIERREGTDAAVSPGHVLSLFLSQFSELWEDLKEPFASAYALQLIAARHGLGIRRRRSSAAQMTLAIPGLSEVKVPVAIRIPATTKEKQLGKGGRGHWGKTMDVPVGEFGLYVREQELRAKDADRRQREKVKAFRELYRIARTGARGDLTMAMKDALATQEARRKAKAAGFGAEWLFNEDEAQ